MTVPRPNYGSSSPGTGGSSGGYSPSPYGSSYNDNGLVYGIGSRGPEFVDTSSIAGIRRAGARVYGGGMEVDRAASWIVGSQATQGEKSRYDGYIKKFFPTGADFNSYANLWAQASQYASTVNRNDPAAKWSPFDALDKMWDQRAKNGGPGGGGGGPTTSTSSSSSISQTSRRDANATIDSAMEEFVGESASKSEQAAFHRRLNREERGAPSTQSGTQRSDGKGNSSSTSSSVSRGVSPGAVAKQVAMEDEGFGEYQYATTYLQAMLDALNSPVRM